MLLYCRRNLIARALALLLALVTSIALIPPLVHAQRAEKKLTKQDVIDLLTLDVSSADVAQQARKSGISFQVTPSVEREIRGAGGTDALINVLKSLAPPAPAPVPSPPTPGGPAVLMIQSSPGQSDVYIDDEPMGSTSPEGRLKLTRLAPGSHAVRVSLKGYQDHEETVTLTAGAVTTVSAMLQKPAVAQISAPPQPEPAPPQTEVTPPAPSGQPGYLGVVPMEQQPAGARGVVISGAAPGGPADQIGLKAYDTILAVNGQAVTTPQALRATLESHQAGEVVNITWYNGSTTLTRQARLIPYPTGQATPQQVTPPTLSNMPHNGFQTFYVAHDHGQNGQYYCAGIMSIGNGMIYYKGVKGNGPVHTFEIPLNTVKEARRNGVYLVALGGFHIRQSRANFNFVLLTQQGQFQPPDTILAAITAAMGR